MDKMTSNQPKRLSKHSLIEGVPRPIKETCHSCHLNLKTSLLKYLILGGQLIYLTKMSCKDSRKDSSEFPILWVYSFLNKKNGAFEHRFHKFGRSMFPTSMEPNS